MLVSDANALHEVLGGDERAVIVGHDRVRFAAYGAPTIAPDRWTRAVIASVPPTSVLMPAPFLRHAQAQLLVPVRALQSTRRSGFADERLRVPRSDLGRLVSRPRRLRGHRARKAALRDPANLSAALGYYRHTLGGLHSDPALQAEQGASMQVPPIATLYLHGVDDGCMPVPGRSVLEEAFSAAGSRVELIAEAGHFLQYEQPARDLELVVDFVAS